MPYMKIQNEMDKLETIEEFVDWFQEVLNPTAYVINDIPMMSFNDLHDAMLNRLSAVLAAVAGNPDKYFPQFIAAILSVLANLIDGELKKWYRLMEDVADSLLEYEVSPVNETPVWIQRFIAWAEEALTRAYNMPVTCECGIKVDSDGDQLMVFNFCGNIEKRPPGIKRSKEGAILVLPLTCTQAEDHFRERHLADIEDVIMKHAHQP